MHRPLILLVLVTVPAAGRAQDPLRSYLSVRLALNPHLTPGGEEVAFQTDITGTLQVWKVSSAGGWPDQLTFFSSSIAEMHWSPAGTSLLVAADADGDQQYQLYLLRPDGTGLTRLTDYPKASHNLGGWSADGRQVFYAANGRDERFFDCYLLDVRTKRARRVFQKDAVLRARALSRDGRRLVVEEVHTPANQDLNVVDTETGEARRLTPHQGDARYQVVDLSPDGATLYLVTDQGRDFLNLAALDVASGRLRFLHDEAHDVETPLLAPSGRRLAFAINRDGYQELVVWDLPGQTAVRLPRLPGGMVFPGSFSRDGGRLAISLSSPTRTDDVWVLDLPAGRLTQVTRSSYAGLDSATFVEPSLVHYPSFDGREIPALLYLPRHAPPDHSLPVILAVHGGPEEQERPFFTNYYQYFVRRGYAVLLPNIRGSSGYGKKYMALDNGPRRWDALKDLNAAVDWVAKHPALDARRVAIFGASYGGFATLAMLAHYPDRFAAGVDLYGVADLKTFLAGTAPYRRPLRIAEYGDPERDGAFLDAISPARHAQKIKAPLLVIQGARDPIVPPSESARIVKQIRSRGGVVEYLQFPDEGHGLDKFDNRLRAYATILAFLDKHVRPGPDRPR
jgi:dipeptidyl aminopeptidase/acylaminoacyl peptidase